MPRVKEVDDPGDDPLLKEIFAKETDTFGFVLNTTKIQAHTPGIMKPATPLPPAVARPGPLAPPLLALASLRAPLTNGCPFLIHTTAPRGMRARAPAAKPAEVPTALTSDLFDEREKAALEYAEAMTFTDRKVGEDLFARVRAQFSEAQIVELTAAVALENFRSKFNVALGIEAQGFCLVR